MIATSICTYKYKCNLPSWFIIVHMYLFRDDHLVLNNQFKNFVLVLPFWAVILKVGINCEVSPIHTGMSASGVIVQVLSRRPYYWDFRSVASPLFIEATVSQQMSWSSCSYNLSNSCSMQFSELQMYGYIIDVPAGLGIPWPAILCIWTNL